MGAFVLAFILIVLGYFKHVGNRNKENLVAHPPLLVLFLTRKVAQHQFSLFIFLGVNCELEVKKGSTIPL